MSRAGVSWTAIPTAVAYSGYPPEPRSDSRTKSGLRKIRRKVSLDFAKFDWTRQISPVSSS